MDRSVEPGAGMTSGSVTSMVGANPFHERRREKGVGRNVVDGSDGHEGQGEGEMEVFAVEARSQDRDVVLYDGRRSWKGAKEGEKQGPGQAGRQPRAAEEKKRRRKLK
jgi:hypothetical protein